MNIHCDICGQITGTVQGVNMTEAEYKQSTSMMDSRCDTCINDHGSFKEMVEEYQKKLKASATEAEAFVKTNRKRGDFDKKVEKILKDKEKMV